MNETAAVNTIAGISASLDASLKQVTDGVDKCVTFAKARQQENQTLVTENLLLKKQLAECKRSVAGMQKLVAERAALLAFIKTILGEDVESLLEAAAKRYVNEGDKAE